MELRGIPLFDVKPAALDALARASEPRAYRRGEVAFSDGDSGTFLLMSGRARVAQAMEGGQLVTLEVMYPGDVWGLAFASQALMLCGDAFVTSKTATGYHIPNWAGRTLCATCPEVLPRVLELIATRLATAHDRIRDFATLNVEGRAAVTLALEALRTGSPHVVLTQEEQAELIGASREQVNRAPDALRGKGYIEATRWGRGVIVRTPARLLALYRR